MTRTQPKNSRGAKKAWQARSRRANGWMPRFAFCTLPMNLRPLPKKSK